MDHIRTNVFDIVDSLGLGEVARHNKNRSAIPISLLSKSINSNATSSASLVWAAASTSRIWVL